MLFPLYPSARESVRDCWDKHPDAVTELSACWLEFRRIFAPAAPARSGKPAPRRPPLADTLVYLDRWLPGTLRRVKAITEKCTGIDGHIPHQDDPPAAKRKGSPYSGEPFLLSGDAAPPASTADRERCPGDRAGYGWAGRLPRRGVLLAAAVSPRSARARSWSSSAR